MTDTTTETNSEQARNSRRVLEGIVSSDAMDKSITIRVERKFKHPKYKKYIRRHSKVHVHDESNEAATGDRVEVMECRPLSKTKRYRLVRVVERPSLPAGALKPGQVQAAATADAMGGESAGSEEVAS
ncbi:MAG: 30S ribosomal protein S17 [Actinomycetales bacterium]|nr:30S ribosomal protein S17 [Actinomycetales bacterium]